MILCMIQQSNTIHENLNATHRVNKFLYLNALVLSHVKNFVLHKLDQQFRAGVIFNIKKRIGKGKEDECQ